MTLLIKIVVSVQGSKPDLSVISNVSTLNTAGYLCQRQAV